nr:thiolase family protein [Desulfobacterales bacterium]
MSRRVAIVGVGQTETATKLKSYTHPELAYKAVRRALDDAGLSLEDIDAVVYGSMDEFDGINCPDRWDIDAGGGWHNKPFIKILTGGSTGHATASIAYQHVASRVFDVVMALGVQRVGENLDAQAVLNKAFNPLFLGDFTLGSIDGWALLTTMHMAKYGSREEQFALASVIDHEHALNNPYSHIKKKVTVEDVMKSPPVCWPIKYLECCPRSDGACAVIMVSEEKARELNRKAAWIRGVQYIVCTPYYGDRPGGVDWLNLAMAGKRLYKMCGITNPMEEIDVIELQAPFPIVHFLALEALGFCEHGEAGKLIESGATRMGGKLPVNPSGGVICTNQIGVAGLVRIAEASLQIMEKADKRQVAGAKKALAVGMGASRGQYQSVMLLTKDWN